MENEKKLYLVDEENNMFELNFVADDFGVYRVPEEQIDDDVDCSIKVDKLRMEYKEESGKWWLRYWEGDHYEYGDRDEGLYIPGYMECNEYVTFDKADAEKVMSKRKADESAMVVWNIGVDAPITPADPLPEMPAIPRGALLVISGRAPIWRYGMAFHAAHGSAAGAVAVYDPKLGAVVVASHVPQYTEGQVISATPCPVV